MQRVCEKLGFQIYQTADVSVVRAEINFKDHRTYGLSQG